MFLKIEKSKICKIICLVVLLFVILGQNVSLAVTTPSESGETKTDSSSDDVWGGLKETANTAGIPTETSETSLPARIGNIISYVLGFVGVIFLILMIAGGLMWMTAGGNEQRVEKAKSLITNAVIGMIIVFSAYAITYFVTNTLLATP